jgi:outer membrane receptor protein involved in Fe transport
LLAPFIATYAQDAEDDDESIFELSPFTIQEDEAIGYQALSTLAGTRIKTDLRDLGAGIQVMTQEFLEDTGATDAATLLAYGLNTEILGEQGNYSGHGLGDTRVQRAQPHLGANRIRGLTSATVTRDFFQTEMPFDAYNTTSVTINRGPNAILFGTGNPAGIINNATKQASLAKEFGQVGIRLGERSSYRFTGDYNMVLIEDTLALRFNYLNEDYNFHQEPSFKNDKRYSVALTAILAENEGSNFLGRTILRANWEDGRIKSSPVRTIPPKDEISDWFDATRHAHKVAFIEELTGVNIAGFVDGTGDAPFVPKFTIGERPDGRRYGWVGTNLANAYVGSSLGGMALVYADINSTEPTIGMPGRPEVQGQVQQVQWNRSECCSGEFHGRGFYGAQVSDSVYRGEAQAPGDAVSKSRSS